MALARALCAEDPIPGADLEDWLMRWRASPAAAAELPARRALQERIARALNASVPLDQRAKLVAALRLVSSDTLHLADALTPAGIPFSDPAPTLSFCGKLYCFSGTFLFGRRNACVAATRSKGALVGPLTRRTDVVVIGACLAPNWAQEATGDQIKRALALRAAGSEIHIVSEARWTIALQT